MTPLTAPTDPPRTPQERPGRSDGLGLSGPDGRHRRGGLRLLAAAGLGSAATALLTAIWRIMPEWNGFDDPGMSLLRTWLSADAVALTGLVLGLVGMLAAVAAFAALRRAGSLPGGLAPTGLVLAAVLGLGLLGMGVISVIGYLTALAMPLILAFLVIQLVRKGGRARWITLVVTAGVLAAGLGSGLLTGPAMSAFGSVLPLVPGAMVDVAPSMMLMGTALVWAAVSVHAARTRGGSGRAAAFVLRHRRAITVLASIGPLPYAVLRLSWLTPWPLMAPGAVDPVTLFWGFALSVGAWAGFVLTLGLIRPWGETFPRWMPAVAGRPVPFAFAAVPGGVVAAGVCVAAVPMVQNFGQRGLSEALASAVVMPFWFWGPMLALAVWAYVLHRRGDGGAAD